MNNLSEYIVEKLRINKDTLIDKSLLDDILLIIADPNCNIKSITNEIKTWVGDYDKKLYCYCAEKEYNERLNDLKDKVSSKISINKLGNSLMAKAINLAAGVTVYRGKDDGSDPIEKIQHSQYDIAFYLYGKIYPIIFEKTKI